MSCPVHNRHRLVHQVLVLRRGLVWVVHVFLYLDYGTIYDSTGGHVDGWVASIFWKDAAGTELEWLFVLFYDKDRIGSETNKNANTGMMCLRELVRTTIINIYHVSRQTNDDPQLLFRPVQSDPTSVLLWTNFLWRCSPVSFSFSSWLEKVICTDSIWLK